MEIINKLNIEQLIKHSTQRLVTAPDYIADTAKLDVGLLLAHVLQVNVSYFYTWPEKELTNSDITEFNCLFEQRLKGKPIAYILGKQAFWAFELDVSECTLIPRADTEILVETGLELVETVTQPKVLDLGTGTGAVALALAYERKDAHIEAVDLVNDAVDLARRNSHKLNLQIQVQQSSWFDNVQTQEFDLIVSNPPYIDPTDQHLEQGDLRFEPHTALIADKHGYADIELIASQARHYLKEGGWLAFEHGFDQGEGVRAIFREYQYQTIKTRQDYHGHERVTFGQFILS